MPITAGYVIETLVTLAAVTALALLILWSARRVGLGQTGGPIELVGRLALDARRAVYLVKVGERVLVVGVGDGSIARLAEIPAAELPPGEPVATGRFADILAAVGRRRSGT